MELTTVLIKLFETATIGIFSFMVCGPLARKDEILFGIHRWVWSRFPKPIYNVVIGCGKCQSFWVAIIFHLFFYGFNPVGIIQFCIMAMFVAYFLDVKM